MAAVLLSEYDVEIPEGIDSLAAFRRWALSDDFPARGRIDFIRGTIEVDMSPSSFYSHAAVVAAISNRLYDRVVRNELGEVVAGQTLVSDEAADLAAEPDVVVLLHESLDSGRVTLTPKADRPDDAVEIVGGPDLVVEVVSGSSVAKDTKRLPSAYFDAGVREYWIADARKDDLVFRVLTRGEGGFVDAEPDADCFRRSTVLAASFRLVRRAGRGGRPVYRLEERE